MCGICGFLERSRGDSEDVLRRMTRAIEHRGPDAVGGFCVNGFALGHRRLSIIDLSEEANQPMHSSDGRYTIVFNGEVYNYQDLIREYGIQTHTSSDTEVVLYLLQRFGLGALKLFNGMFALAFLDREKESLIIARDRLGIKPLYYHASSDQLIFASELKAMQAIAPDVIPLNINTRAIGNYLHLGYIPATESIYNEVQKLAPGHYISWSPESYEISSWWQPSIVSEADVIKNEQEALKLVERGLLESIEKRLISDVSLGCFLSGGTDSSLVTAVAQKLSSTQINTFSISFENPNFDESHYARAVAKELGTMHREFKVGLEEAEGLLLELNEVFDEPFADTSAIPTQILSKMTREYVKVALSGDGGDETHFGYGAYQWAERMNHRSIKNLRHIIGFVLKFGNDRHRRAANMFRYNRSDDIRSHIFSQEQYTFSRGEVRDLLANHWYDPESFSSEPHLRDLDVREQQAIFDLKNYLPGDLLTKVDRSSMRYGLEVRVPLLDHNLVEQAINISPSIRTKNGEPKYLLKKLLSEFIPSELVYRPKWGFSVPLSKWLNGPLKGKVLEELSSSNIEAVGMFNAKSVEKLLHKFYSGQDYLYNRVWITWNLQRWLQKHSANIV